MELTLQALLTLYDVTQTQHYNIVTLNVAAATKQLKRCLLGYHAIASAHSFTHQHEYASAHRKNICVHDIATDPEVILQRLPSRVRTQVVDKQPSANDSNAGPGCRSPVPGTSSISPEG